MRRDTGADSACPYGAHFLCCLLVLPIGPSLVAARIFGQQRPRERTFPFFFYCSSAFFFFPFFFIESFMRDQDQTAGLSIPPRVLKPANEPGARTMRHQHHESPIAPTE